MELNLIGSRKNLDTFLLLTHLNDLHLLIYLVHHEILVQQYMRSGKSADILKMEVEKLGVFFFFKVYSTDTKRYIVLSLYFFFTIGFNLCLFSDHHAQIKKNSFIN